MAMARMVRLAINFDNPGREWWDNGGQDLWDALIEGFDNNDVVLDDSLAESWLSQAASLPGWSDGPEHAPHPVFMKDVDEDEEL